MGRSQESFNKKEVRSRKEKKRKEKEKKRLAKKEGEKGGNDMIAYVDEHGNITSTPPDPTQKEEIEAEDIEVDKLALLNPQYVWMHSLTKSPFERWELD